MTTTASGTSPTPPPSDEDRRRRLIRRLVITLVVIACCAGLVVAAQHTRRGDDEAATGISGVPTSKVQLEAPPAGSQALSQSQIEIDLLNQYDARLIVNGTLIPDNEIQHTLVGSNLNQVLFTPGPGKTFERLPAGNVCVDAAIFRVDGNPEQIPNAHWCFDVT